MRNPYSANIDMAATPPQVFAVLTDAGLLRQWTPQIVEVKLPEGGLRVGATCHAVVQEFGRRFAVELVVLALEPNARIAYHMATPMWSGHIEYVITDKHPSTGVAIIFLPDQPKHAPRFVARAVGELARPLMEWRLRSILAAVRRLAESNR